MSFTIRQEALPQEIAATAEQVMVRMRDGVALATDVYLPDRVTKHEVVFMRTPYDKTSRYCAFPLMARYFNEAGYVFVGQDCRGKYRSEGATEPYVTDVVDAYDTVDWMIRQPWSNGLVGLLGASYYGYTVWAGVASGHPAIQAAIPQITGIDLPTMHVGSQWRQAPPNMWGADDLVQIWTQKNDFYVDLDYDLRPREMLREAEENLGRSLGIERLWRNIESQEWVNPYGEHHPYFSTSIPIMHWVEWFDPGLGPPGLRDFHYFRQLSPRPELHYLRVNSADHNGFLLADVPRRPDNDPGINDAPYELRIRTEVDDQIEFFDTFLRGRSTTWTDSERVRWHHSHVGWNRAGDWPAVSSEPRRWYLDPSGDSDGCGALTPHRTVETHRAQWVHDPSSPVPSSTTQDQLWTFLEDYPDERELAARDDVLAFASGPLDRDVDVIGTPILDVTLSSTAPSMHLFVKLQDELPDGTVRPLTRAEVVVDLARGPAHLRVRLMDCAYRFRAGHRIRIHLTSSDYPYYLVHPGTAENPWTAERLVSAGNEIRLGGLDGAFIELPTQVRPATGEQG